MMGRLHGKMSYHSHNEVKKRQVTKYYFNNSKIQGHKKLWDTNTNMIAYIFILNDIPLCRGPTIIYSPN